MAKLFDRLVNEGLYNEWASLLDWLLDDSRFRNWSSGYVGSFTKKVKRLPHIGSNTYFYDRANNLSFPSKDSTKKFLIMMCKGDSEAKDLVRHIRNGIAHGKAEISKYEGTLYIEIIDYTKAGVQSAYLYIPVDYINKIHKVYIEVEKSMLNNKKAEGW